MRWKLLLLLAWLLGGGGGCLTGVSLQTVSLPSAPLWDDGSYLGVHEVPTPQVIRVAVDISRGRIVTIRVLQHPAWRTPEEQDGLLRLVVESQTTEGHVPRGTGSEQDRLLRAIDDALSKAQSGHPSVP